MSKISELSDGGVIQGGDTLIAVRSGGNVKVTYGGSTTANIDGGTIDGTVIGGSSAAAGTFTTVTADGLTVDGNTVINKDPASTIVSYSNSQMMLDQSGGANVRSTIGFGAGSDGTYIPSAISYQTTDATGSTKGTLNFYTRDVTTDSPTLLRQKIDSNGDISFYEDTGTTAKFFWDASAESLGIGTSSPTFRLVSANSSSDGGWLYSTGAVSVLGLGGYSNAGDGAFQIRYDRATGSTTFNGGSRDTPTERMRIDGASGNVGINTTTPAAKLEIGGAGEGIILASPDGTRYKITVANGGTLTVTAV